MSAQTEEQLALEQALARKGRMVSLVIAGTMILWMLVQFVIRPMLGMTTRVAILIDLLAMAGLAWSFIVSWQIKRARKAAQSSEAQHAAPGDLARGSARDDMARGSPRDAK